ncbi:hypothetical protein ABTO67_18245, partial [Acinetobacter baumannii]
DLFIADPQYPNIRNLLFRPFYLSEIAKEFSAVRTLPKNKVSVIQNMITKAHESARGRRFQKGITLKDVLVSLQLMMEKMALAL